MGGAQDFYWLQLEEEEDILAEPLYNSEYDNTKYNSLQECLLRYKLFCEANASKPTAAPEIKPEPTAEPERELKPMAAQAIAHGCI